MLVFFFQAEDGIRDVERSRGLGDVYKKQLGDGQWTVDVRDAGALRGAPFVGALDLRALVPEPTRAGCRLLEELVRSCQPGLRAHGTCLLYTYDAADDPLRSLSTCCPTFYQN